MADGPEDREEFQVDGVYVQDRDMDNNGIPDFQQNHANGSPDNPYYGPGADTYNDATRGSSYDDATISAAAGTTSSSSGSTGDEAIDEGPDRADFGPDAASDSPYGRQTREPMGHAAATYSTAKPGQSERQERTNTADAANEAVRGSERKGDANVNRALDDEKYREALNNLEVRRLRERPRKESKLSEEVRQASNHHRTDDKDGLALGKAIIAGLKGGVKHERQRAKERKSDRDNMAADKVMLAFVGKEAELRRDQIAEAKIERAARERAAKEAAEKAAGKGPGGDGPGAPGPDAPSPDPSTPGPDAPNPGPDAPNPGGDGPGGDGPGGGKPAEADKPKEAEVTAPEAPKPANENDAPAEPLRETGRAAEHAKALHGETQTADAPAPERQPAAAKEKAAETAKSGVDPKSAARDAAGPVSSDVKPVEANASAGAGAAMAMVNPALGVAATAAKSRHAQVEAGAEHVDLRKAKPQRQMPQSKGPGPSSISVSVPARQPESRQPPVRRLETPRGDNVVEFRRPDAPARPNGIRAQAQGLRPSRRPDVTSRGADVAQPRTRIMGVGSAMGRFVERDVRGPGGKGAETEGHEIAAAHRSRGNGR